ncbi:MAG: hypothetical protein H6737_19515 [Alphaproteobacteria bacterium]|nr:hypothetical protein [Alphaproteobacteria bacterium]
MIALLALAHADDRVHHVEWAQRFELAEAHPYRHSATPRDIREGWLVELHVAPDTMVPRQIGVPVLWIGDDLAVRTSWGSGCAVVWVPGDHDLAKEPVFFGSTTLPEQMDAERSAAEHAEASAKGWGPVPVHHVESDVLKVADFRAVAAVAKVRSDACR